MKRCFVATAFLVLALGDTRAEENLPSQWVDIAGRTSPDGPRLVLTAKDGATRELKADAATMLIAYLANRAWSHMPNISVNLDGGNRGLVRFDLSGAEKFTKAEVVLVVTPSAKTPPKPFELGLFALTGPFDPSTNWLTQPDAEATPVAVAKLAMAGVTDSTSVRLDVTKLALAWAKDVRKNHGLRLAPATPLGRPKVSRTPDASIDQAVLGLFDFVSIDELVPAARRDDKLALVVVRGIYSDKARVFNEMILYATALSDPRVRSLLNEHFVLARVWYQPMAYSGLMAPRVDPLGAFGAKIGDIKPLALVIVNRVGEVKGKLTNLGTFDPHQIAAFLRSALPADDVADPPKPGKTERAYRAAAVAWREGRRDAANAVFDRLVQEADAPFDVKARARLAWPDAMDAFERFEPTGTSQTGSTERVVTEKEFPAQLERAIGWLLAHQGPDGAWSAAMGRAQDLAITSLTAHALLEWRKEVSAVTRTAIDRTLAKADTWIDRAMTEAFPKSVSSFGAAYLVDYALARADASAAAKKRAQDAVLLLLEGQLPNGAWAYDYGFGVGWTGGFGGWPKTDKGRAHSVNTGQALVALLEAKRAGYRVGAEALARGAKALEAMRVEVGGWTYTWPEPINFIKTDQSIARAPLCEHARLLLGGGKPAELRATLGVFLKHHEALRIPVKLNEGWGNPHGLSSYFYHYAYLHAARAAAELGDDVGKEVIAATRKALLAHVEIDGTWVDWEQMGKTYGTASALLALRLTR